MLFVPPQLTILHQLLLLLLLLTPPPPSPLRHFSSPSAEVAEGGDTILFAGTP